MSDIFVLNFHEKYYDLLLSKYYVVKDPRATHLSVNDLKRIGFRGLYLKNVSKKILNIQDYKEFIKRIRTYYFDISQI